jgi:hypothetical protein
MGQDGMRTKTDDIKHRKDGKEEGGNVKEKKVKETGTKISTKMGKKGKTSAGREIYRKRRKRNINIFSSRCPTFCL